MVSVINSLMEGLMFVITVGLLIYAVVSTLVMWYRIIRNKIDLSNMYNFTDSVLEVSDDAGNTLYKVNGNVRLVDINSDEVVIQENKGGNIVDYRVDINGHNDIIVYKYK